MKIKTKHNTDDWVWIVNKDTQKVESRRIDCMEITVFKDSTNITYLLDFGLSHNPLRNVKMYNEKGCFSTKQDLLNSL